MSLPPIISIYGLILFYIMIYSPYYFNSHGIFYCFFKGRGNYWIEFLDNCAKGKGL